MHLILLPAQEEIDCVSQYLRANSYLYSWIHRIGPKIFMKNITNYICLLILTTLLSSCLKGENINTLRVGIAFPSGDNSWWSTASYYAVTHASSLGQFYYMANADSTAQQQQQLTRMAYPTLTQEACKAIILSDMGQPTDSIQHYIDMGIGVILDMGQHNGMTIIRRARRRVKIPHDQIRRNAQDVGIAVTCIAGHNAGIRGKITPHLRCDGTGGQNHALPHRSLHGQAPP